MFGLALRDDRICRSCLPAAMERQCPEASFTALFRAERNLGSLAAPLCAAPFTAPSHLPSLRLGSLARKVSVPAPRRSGDATEWVVAPDSSLRIPHHGCLHSLGQDAECRSIKGLEKAKARPYAVCPGNFTGLLLGKKRQAKANNVTSLKPRGLHFDPRPMKT